MVLLHGCGTGSSISNCYDLSTSIQSSHGSHKIIDNYSSGVTLTNNYITGDISKAVGKGGKDITVTNAQVQTKSTTDFTKTVTDPTSVAYLLNGNKNKGVWAQGKIEDKLINDGYPYLVDNN